MTIQSLSLIKKWAANLAAPVNNIYGNLLNLFSGNLDEENFKYRSIEVRNFSNGFVLSAISPDPFDQDLECVSLGSLNINEWYGTPIGVFLTFPGFPVIDYVLMIDF